MACIAAAMLCVAAFGCTRVAQNGTAGGRNPWTLPGVLRMASRQNPENLNPLLATQTVDFDLSMFWAGYLFNWSDRNQYVPELALRVPTLENGDIAKDGLSVTYHLRRGVRWQDGAPFSADDVIYTWQQMMNPQNAVVSRFGYDIVSRIDKIDDYTIRVHLKHRFAPFVSNFFTLTNHSNCILPKHLLAKYPNINRIAFNSMPVGTGPFRVVEYQHGSLIRFEANRHYWRGPPKLNRIEYHIIENDNTLAALTQSHEIDFYFRASEALAQTLRNIPGTRVVLAPFTRFADIGFNTSMPALRDVRVRQALAYATDRNAIIDKVTHGIEMPGDSDQPPFFWAYDRNVQRYPYDPLRAAALLDAAGWRTGPDGMRSKDGQPLQLTLVSFTGSTTASETEVLLQSMWRKVGVDVAIKNYSSAQLYATLSQGGIEQSGKFDAIFENWANGTDPDDSILFLCSMKPPAGWNVYGFCNRDVDAAESDALTHYDRASRKADYDKVQEALSRNLPIIVLWYQREFDIVNTDLRNYKPAHAVTPFWNSYEWSI